MDLIWCVLSRFDSSLPHRARLPNFRLDLQSDGRVVVGATVEPGRWDTRTTAAGVASLLGNAIDTCPELAEWEVVDTWAGLRPTTPDMLPILGRLDGYLDNVYAAAGYWRNGILLAPRAAEYCIFH